MLALVLSQTRKFALACAGVRKRWKCPVVDDVLFTHTPVGHWKKIAIFGGRCSKMTKEFQFLSALHNGCQVSSRQESLPARLEGKIKKREPCCCCCCDFWCFCESVKLGGAGRLQSCVFLESPCGIQDGVSFCIPEHLHPHSFSRCRVACICPFAPCCNGVCGIIGTQYIQDLHFFFGPSNCEMRFSVPIVIGPSIENQCVTLLSEL